MPESRRKSNVGYRYKGKEEINIKYLQGIVGSMVSTMAVSYTHLDVYKRQAESVWHGLCIRDRSRKGCHRSGE